MEIWIIGGALVALMVYVSTRIKKAAAAAYEREIIETDDFTLVKAGGFLHPLRDDSPYAFEAFTKEFGEDEAAKFHQAKALVTIHENLNDAISDKIVEAENTENGVSVKTFRKILRKNNKFYQLEISVLSDYREKYLERINEMMGSFTLK